MVLVVNYKLHEKISRKLGEERTCGTKHRFATEALANKAAEEHNRWRKRSHDVEAYPCCFCGRWHIGKIIPPKIIKRIVK